jgi:hypothetical protein
VEGFSETVFKHTSGAPEKFLIEAAPSLLSYSEGATDKLVMGVNAAKSARVAKTDEERVDFLMKFGLTKKQAEAAIKKGEQEEQKAPESVWDMAQAVTALARGAAHQDQRLMLEQVGGKMLDKVKV